jgi:hypothetical protein
MLVLFHFGLVEVDGCAVSGQPPTIFNAAFWRGFPSGTWPYLIGIFKKNSDSSRHSLVRRGGVRLRSAEWIFAFMNLSSPLTAMTRARSVASLR